MCCTCALDVEPHKPEALIKLLKAVPNHTKEWADVRESRAALDLY